MERKKFNTGYGYFKLDNRCCGTHRVVMSIINDGINNDSSFVLHKCDNPSCVNPSHLYFGNGKDNEKDKKERNRHARGEKINTAKLKEEDVLEMRKIRKETGLSYQNIAKMFGVRKITARRNIFLGISWKHIPLV